MSAAEDDRRQGPVPTGAKPPKERGGWFARIAPGVRGAAAKPKPPGARRAPPNQAAMAAGASKPAMRK